MHHTGTGAAYASRESRAAVYECTQPNTKLSRLCRKDEELAELLVAMQPYLDLGSGLSVISHKKKAKFWRAVVDIFPNFIDFLCSSNDIGQVASGPFVRVTSTPLLRLLLLAKGNPDHLLHPRPGMVAMPFVRSRMTHRAVRVAEHSTAWSAIVLYSYT